MTMSENGTYFVANVLAGGNVNSNLLLIIFLIRASLKNLRNFLQSS